jgi:hypothetical protein
VIKAVSCVFLTCDGAEDCDPWEDGVPHFPSVEQAVAHARSCGWVIVGDKAICRDHAAQADCWATGHRYREWGDREMYGVSYRTRWCEHCNDTEYDPPFHELSLLAHAAMEMGDGAGESRG